MCRCIEEDIKIFVIKLVKEYKDKGPLCVKVNMTNNNLEIYIKGVMSKMEKMILTDDESVKKFHDLCKNFKEEAANKILDGLLQITGKQYEVVSIKLDRENDSKRFLFKIKNNG